MISLISGISCFFSHVQETCWRNQTDTYMPTVHFFTGWPVFRPFIPELDVQYLQWEKFISKNHIENIFICYILKLHVNKSVNPTKLKMWSCNLHLKLMKTRSYGADLGGGPQAIMHFACVAHSTVLAPVFSFSKVGIYAYTQSNKFTHLKLFITVPCSLKDWSGDVNALLVRNHCSVMWVTWWFQIQ